MNIQKQIAYRNKIQEGDYFSIQLKTGNYVLGRVIRHRPSTYPVLNEYLIYIYSGVFVTVAPIPKHSPQELLLPPLFVNKMGWTKGYFGYLKSATILDDDVLKKHCFSGCYFSPTGFVNEFGEPVSKSDPCGSYGLDNYKMLDYYLSKKFGFDPETAGRENS